jgi:hypothetical protein
MLETASIAGGAVAALFLSLVVGFLVYVRWHQQKKQELVDENGLQNGYTNGHHNAAADVVDGPSGQACCCQQSQMYFSNNQLSSNVTNATNGDGDLQHPQQQQFQAMPHVHPPHKKRPFGPHHYRPVSMAEVILKR